MSDDDRQTIEEARRIVEAFRAAYPHGASDGSLAGDLSRVWRVCEHRDRQLDALRAKLHNIRKDAVQYKRCRDFMDFQKVIRDAKKGPTT